MKTWTDKAIESLERDATDIRLVATTIIGVDNGEEFDKCVTAYTNIQSVIRMLKEKNDGNAN